MKVVIASGKGGTGKTTIATSLAFLMARDGLNVAYLDCDVEEPNGHLFLQPVITWEGPIEKPVPVIDSQRCDHCGRCSEVCRFGAIVSLPQATIVFSELCHACGGCQLACPKQAIREARRRIGTLRLGHAGTIRFVSGILQVGEAMSPPAIRAVKAAMGESEVALLDAPPGTGCPVVETLREADRVLLVTEPTPFGWHDLQLAIRLVTMLKLPAAIIVNRVKEAERDNVWCQRLRSLDFPIWAEITDKRAVAEAYSRGKIVAQGDSLFAEQLKPVVDKLKALIDERACGCER
jgi:MinD superfamily P-loop ATPase